MTTTTRALKAELKRAFARRIDAVEDEGLLIDLQRSLDDDAGFRSLLLDLQCSRDADALPSISGAGLPGAVRAATAADALLETLKRRGAGRWREFLAQSGGCGTVREIARLTGMSTDAIHKGAQRRQLLAYKESGQLKFPLCQFEHGRVIPGLRELAGMVHPFYNKHRILPPAPDSEDSATPSQDGAVAAHRGADSIPPGLTGARLALMWAVQQVVRNGLTVLGVSAPEQM